MQTAQLSGDAEEQLHRNQLLLKMAGRAARLGGWTFAVESQTLVWSDEICEIHDRPAGYLPALDEGIGYYLPEYRGMITRTVERCLSEGTPFDFEAELTTATQRRIWVRAVGEAVRDTSGQIIGFQGALQDITGLRLHELERHALATKLSATLQNMSDAFFTLNRNWHITFVNEEMTRTVNRRREDLLHKCLWDVFPGTENSLFHRSFQRAVETGKVATEVGFYEPLGKWFELRSHPTDDGVAVYFQDVTQKRRDDEQLRLLQACVERMNDIIVVTEAEAVGGLWPRVLYVNKAFERHTGYRPHEIIGKTPRILQGPRTQRDVLDRIRASLKRWEPVREEILNYTKNGEEIWLELDIVPVADAAGQYTHWISIERNITERKRAAEALRQKDNLLKVGGRVGKVGGWTAVPSVNAVEWSDEIYLMLDWPRTSPPTLGEFLSIFSSESRASFRAALDTCVARGTSFDREFQITTCAGEPKWVRVAAEPALAEGGQVNSVHGALQDTTSMKQVEERLVEQAALLDKAQDAIWVLNLDGTVAFWNRSAERIYGWTAEEVRHRAARELLFNNPNVYDRCRQTVMEEGEWVGEIEHKTQDGNHILLVSRWTLVRDEAGQPRSILAINTDVTHQKLLEQQFLRAQRMESIGTLAGGIAHDLNNVLAPIMMSIELLKDSLPNPDDQAVLKTIEVSARRGADMIKQVLSFARGVEGKRHEVRIRDVLGDLDQILRETISKNISIVSTVAPDLWQVQADPTQLQQVLMNLFVNARDSMPNGGRIAISAENMTVDAHYAAMNIESRVGAYVKIEVEDNGAGIPPAIQDRVFDPFFTTKPVGEGTGLGLATTLAIVKSHGGFVRLYSEVDKGTRFRIYLPADPDAVSTQSGDAKPSVPRGNGELIMVVDDEAAIRQVTRQTLEAYGYRVIVASNGAEAVALYAQDIQGIDLVLTDMMMPVMDGPATIQALRQINPLVKLIGASGISQNGKVARASGSGLKHFLPKPYTAEVMLRLIDTVLKG
ncbi:PAS domain S-box protein [Hydrogenophaga sp.]|uniref:PAS domain-containing hybrid sensor histidine kinase/response regulator n=1 Tax=Hydrogenophaga sp. TaxID=1904254 RepID=UPI0025BAD810|nr:PAS domain S-box protein [Hydrogenophaga sp.]MBT9463264.1 PAS domain S-box protein [Hydrogenophaga sp.]